MERRQNREYRNTDGRTQDAGSGAQVAARPAPSNHHGNRRRAHSGSQRGLRVNWARLDSFFAMLICLCVSAIVLIQYFERGAASSAASHQSALSDSDEDGAGTGVSASAAGGSGNAGAAGSKGSVTALGTSRQLGKNNTEAVSYEAAPPPPSLAALLHPSDADGDADTGVDASASAGSSPSDVSPSDGSQS
ncbi:MAG: hypothetical protein LBU58_08515, partial [Clostridiales bacterium]|nr:hypothetical protein [Clostridiales bacterium]